VVSDGSPSSRSDSSASSRPTAKEASHGLLAEPDHILAGLVGEGNRAAYSVLVTRHVDRHVAFAERVLGGRAAAEDAVQEACVKLWVNAARYDRNKAKFTTWFYRIVLNQCLDQKRKKRPDALPEGFDVVDERDGPDRELHDLQRRKRIGIALANLSGQQSAAITLCYLEGLTNREAADILDLNIKALESLLTRGRKKLAGLLAEEAVELLDPL
jgi:RNA polymerase sigma-70 factor (ECF subfamily)